MDTKGYLQLYGWKEGEALRHGGLRKPILVKHKRDTKGLGHDAGGTDMWWERVFDGQLKALEVGVGGGAISFQLGEVVASAVAKRDSPLYRMFVQGEGLSGTIEVEKQAVVSIRGANTGAKRVKKSRGEEREREKGEKRERREAKRAKRAKKAEKKAKKEAKRAKKEAKRAKKDAKEAAKASKASTNEPSP